MITMRRTVTKRTASKMTMICLDLQHLFKEFIRMLFLSSGCSNIFIKYYKQIQIIPLNLYYFIFASVRGDSLVLLWLYIHAMSVDLRNIYYPVQSPIFIDHKLKLMNCKEDAQSQYFTVMSYQTTPQISNEEAGCFHYANQSTSKPHHEYENTLSTTKMSMIHKNNQPDSDSYYGELQEIMEKIPQTANHKIHSNESAVRQSKAKSGIEVDKQQLIQKSKWVNEAQLNCIIDYQGKIVETLCKLNGSQLIFVNGGCRFKLGKITKMKILYEQYQKCIWFTFDDQAKTQLKFKIYLENDSNDDLYLLFSRILVQKLNLLGYEILDKVEEEEEVDRFVMAGDILKKSQFVGRWDLRKVVITDRIESFKNDICTFEISNIKEIWTRFDVHKDNLIVKLRHGLLKTELAIPLANYSYRFSKHNWLYRIYRLISAHSI